MPWIEPVGLNVQWSSDMPSVYLSTVAVSAAIVDLSTDVTITVTVKDAQGVPMRGIVVVLSTTGSSNTLTQPAAVTDASGVATGTLSSSVAGDKVVSATADGLLIEQTASVTVASAAPPAFSPDDLAGLEWWLAADAIVGLADADPVTTWEDESGNERDAAQGTAANQPTYRTNVQNGKPVVRFDGVNDCLVSDLVTASLDYTIFGAWRYITIGAGTQNTNFFNGTTSSSNGYALEVQESNSRNILHRAVANITDGTGTTNFELWTATNAVRTDPILYINGVAQGMSGSGAPNTPTMQTILGARNTDGTSAPANVDIAELLVYSRVLTSIEREQVEDYLMDKYGL
jgi:Big-like domain-containing protein